MGIIKKNSYIEKGHYTYFLEFNIYFFLIIVNFITYSIYAVLSKYNILLLEILINLNFIIFYYFYKKDSNEKISFYFSFKKSEIFFFLGLLFFLVVLAFSQLKVPIFSDELATTRRATRNAYFSSFLFVNILNFDYLKTIPFKYIIQILNLIQILFVISIFYFFKKKHNILSLIFILIVTFILRLIIKDGVHHPPLNHIFSSIFISFFGLNHFVIRISYLIPFWIFLISIYKLIRESLSENLSMIFTLSISTFPLLLLGSVSPDYSIYSCIIFTYLLFYFTIKKNVDYRFCILIISIGILFRITIFTGFILIGLSFIADYVNKKFLLINKILQLIKVQKVLLLFLIFFPLLIVSLGGTPAFEGLDNTSPINNFLEAIESKILVYSLMKQIPSWYYLFIIFILFSTRRIEIACFFIFNLIIYFSVESGMWGEARYVLEYGVPFFLIGHFIFIKLLINKKKYLLSYFFTIMIIFFNIYDFYKFPSSNISGDIIYEKGFHVITKDKNKNTKYVNRPRYSYDKAYAYIGKLNAKNNTLMLGTTYGVLPQIIENYSYNEIVNILYLRNNFDEIINNSYSLSEKIIEINETDNLTNKIKKYLKLMKKNNVVKGTDSAALINMNNFYNINKIGNLKYLLIADFAPQDIKRKDIVEFLLSNKWILEEKFEDKAYRTTLLLFKKIE